MVERRSIAISLLAGALIFLVLPVDAREASTDRPGLDYRTFELSAPDPAECEATCRNESRCRAWTFSWPGSKGTRAMCALKRGVPPKQADTCCISGIKAKGGQPTAEPPKGDAVETTPLPPPGAEPAPSLDQPEPAPSAPPVAIPANKEEGCREYADNAERQNRENAQLNCGFSGGRWGYSTETYFRWCMRNGDAARIANTQARESMLANCRGNGAAVPSPPAIVTPPPAAVVPDPAGIDGRCRDYADRSVAQVDDNLRFNCGFSGGAWGGTQAQFFSQCMEIGPDEAGVGFAVRERELAQCRGGGSAASDCEIYADRVIALGVRVRGTPCARLIATWSTERTSILEWCEGSVKEERDVTLELRTEEINLCLNRPIGNQHCRDYAQQAMDQIDQMVRFECGFSGPLWFPDYDTHLRFCLDRRNAVLEHSQSQRQLMLESCEAGQFRRSPQELRQ